MITKEEIETLRKILQKYDDSAKEPVSRVDQLIDDAISNFDFERVRKYISFVGGSSVPSVVDLKDTARYLLRQACDLFEEEDFKQQTQAVYATGNFEAVASRACTDSPVNYVRLVYMIEKSDSFA